MTLKLIPLNLIVEFPTHHAPGFPMTRIVCLTCVTATALSAIAFSSAIAGEKYKATGFAKQRSAAGTVLVKTAADAPWTLPELNAPVAKESWVLALPGS